MTVQNKTTTLVGASAVVTQAGFIPQADGSTLVVVSGTATDSLGNVQVLTPVQVSYPAGTALIANIMAAALSKIRIANGLEV